MELRQKVEKIENGKGKPEIIMVNGHGGVGLIVRLHDIGGLFYSDFWTISSEKKCPCWPKILTVFVIILNLGTLWIWLWSNKAGSSSK